MNLDQVSSKQTGSCSQPLDHCPSECHMHKPNLEKVQTDAALANEGSIPNTDQKGLKDLPKWFDPIAA